MARVDCDEHKDLCRDYQIGIYPTIYVFHGKEYSVYNGFRTAEALESFVRRHGQPIITELSSVGDVDQFSKTDRVTVVGYFDEKDSKSAATFGGIAKDNRDDCLFGHISDTAFGDIEGLRQPAIVLYKAFDDGKDVFTEDFSPENIENFLIESTLPLIPEIGFDIRLSSQTVRGPYA